MIAITAGKRHSWIAVLPSLVASGESFSLRIRAEDEWGNPSGKGSGELFLTASLPVEGLPEQIALLDGQVTAAIEGLRPTAAGDLLIELRDRRASVWPSAMRCRSSKTSRGCGCSGGFSCPER